MKQRLQELWVVFDTNALFTQVASDLFRKEISELMQQCEQKSYNDLSISWYLPEAVRHERQYQMCTKALEYLPTIEKVERLLGHKLNITEQILKQQVETTIEQQIKSSRIQVLPVDYSKVDWNSVMINSVYRNPPFDVGEKEKGFRDALIAESFFQLLKECQNTSKRVWLTLVTNDGLLGAHVNARATGEARVRVCTNLDELKGLINTITSQIDESYVAELQKKADTYFLTVDDKSSFYYKAQISDSINQKYAAELNALPEGADSRQQKQVIVSRPRFVRKEHNRIYWITIVRIKVEAHRYVSSAAPVDTHAPRPALTVNPSLTKNVPKFEQPVGATGLLQFSNLFGEKVLVKIGTFSFELEWSVTLGKSGKLGSGKIGAIKFVESVWSES